jgi:DNA modification methylase
MKISFLHKTYKNNKKESPLVVRVRGKTSKEFELVLDPFIGSGTTVRVCDKLGRSFVGYDLKNYI